ncbi:MAG TPA: iron ABC transporter permease, partial [Calditrichaeota bacterium]|nr:iron ABC transporter permease [Calditrichota bacterium]
MKKLIYIGATVLFAFLILLPLLLMITSSFFEHGVFTLHNYLNILNKNNLLLLFRSTVLSFAVATLSTLIGGFFAFTLTKTNLPMRGGLKLLFLIPLFISPYILAVSWVDFFILFKNGAQFIYGPAGVIFVLSLILVPLSIIIISSGLINVDTRLEEAGLMMADYRTTLVKIVLPLLKPAIVSSFVLSFVLAISEFSVPAFLSVNMLTTEIFMQFSAFYNYDLAVANSMLLIVICISLLMAERYYLAEAPFFSVSAKSSISKKIELEKSKYPLLFIHFSYLTFAVLTPVIVLALQSFNDGPTLFLKAFTILSAVMIDSLLYA